MRGNASTVATIELRRRVYCQGLDDTEGVKCNQMSHYIFAILLNLIHITYCTDWWPLTQDKQKTISTPSSFMIETR